ncbi:MAG: hypothetical protein NT005_01715 [Spirochaetes bacterium]|nr:hypothetical protein [Spirochaetota bacterium]
MTLRSLSFLSGGALVGIDLRLVPRLEIDIVGKGGYFYGFFNQDTSKNGGNPYVGGGIGLSYLISPLLSVRVEALYRNYLGMNGNVEISLGTRLHHESRVRQQGPELRKGAVEKDGGLEEQKTGVAITRIEFADIFPVFFKFYDTNPIGRVTLRNFDQVVLKNIRTSLFVKQYMDNPKEAAAIARLEPGEEKEISVYGLFNKSVLDITEGMKASASITMRYVKDDTEISTEHIQTIRLYNRNAITWDDDRRASAFVTAKDPTVMKFSKNIAGWIKGEAPSAVDQNLLSAIALHEALDVIGVSYVVDPTTPYIEYSKSKLAIDYLQFPKQTLEFLAGDCDDLSILYAALLESVGIETAFLTTPGHIFVAFSLDMPPDQARTQFLLPEDLIIMDGKAWIPVENTIRKAGFLRSWTAGAKQWRENLSRDQSRFIPMHDAWKTYEPVDFPGTASIEMPPREKVVAAYKSEVGRFIAREIAPQEEALRAELKSKPDNPKVLNRLGVLFAHYGMNEKAEKEFIKVLQQQEYLPALINIGNIRYLREDILGAQMYYMRAQKASPDNAKVLLGLARVSFDLGDGDATRSAFRRLKEIDPGLAGRFAYLDQRGDEARRSDDLEKVKGVMAWDEE